MKTLASNKRAFYDYQILEKEIAGIKLLGHEVKSVKQGQVSLKGAYVVFYKGEPYLVGANIPLYKHANTISRRNYDPERMRKLLLTRKQIEKWATKRQAQKLVIVPLRVLLDRNLVKVEVALAKPLRKYQKKTKAKERAEKRKQEREGKLLVG